MSKSSMSTSENSEIPERSDLTEAELRELPTFEEYFKKQMEQRENFVQIQCSGLYFPLLAQFFFLRQVLTEISKNSTTFETESEEFTNEQKAWWAHYVQLMALRAFVLHFYFVPAPNWYEIIPERYYCGVTISKDDFEAFRNRHRPKNLVVQKAESEEDYGDQLKRIDKEKEEAQNLFVAEQEKRGKKMVETLLKDPNDEEEYKGGV